MTPDTCPPDTPAATATGDPPQRFHVSHADETAFRGDGLRPYSVYRDLGIAAASGGLATAQVIRMCAPFSAEFSQRHHHAVRLQLVYVLRGWFRTRFDGEGEHTFQPGSCWLQPPGIRHTVVGWSDDCELLEIVLPADFATHTDP
jgi:uncharacterized RmlC-like cupin family protein